MYSAFVVVVAHVVGSSVAPVQDLVLARADDSDDVSIVAPKAAELQHNFSETLNIGLFGQRSTFTRRRHSKSQLAGNSPNVHTPSFDEFFLRFDSFRFVNKP